MNHQRRCEVCGAWTYVDPLDDVLHLPALCGWPCVAEWVLRQAEAEEGTT